MNRKLHNTILAFSVTGMMLFIGLVVAEPALPQGAPAPAEPPAIATQADDLDRVLDESLDALIEARIEARIQAFETELAQASGVGDSIALTAGLVANAATEVALLAVLGEANDGGDRRASAGDAEARARPAAQRTASTREQIAVPYFSFARGSRAGRS